MKKRLTTDPMYKLEHLKQDEQKSMKVAPTLLEIQKKQELMKDDLKLHRFMMKTFREDEKVLILFIRVVVVVVLFIY